jgi:hypothetical protein
MSYLWLHRFEVVVGIHQGEVEVVGRLQQAPRSLAGDPNAAGMAAVTGNIDEAAGHRHVAERRKARLPEANTLVDRFHERGGRRAVEAPDLQSALERVAAQDAVQQEDVPLVHRHLGDGVAVGVGPVEAVRFHQVYPTNSLGVR